LLKIYGSVRGLLKSLLPAVLVIFAVLLPRGVWALSIEEEATLGREFLSHVKKYFDVVEDDFLNDYMNRLGKYLSSSITDNPFPFSFYIIKDNSLNAFAGPGGHIFVFTGLINEMDRVDELAAVVCHEIGHVTSRHLSTRIEQGKKIGLATLAGVLAGVLIGGPAAGAIVTGSMAAGIQTQLHYSRNDEREADQRGFAYMREIGYDPGAMVSVLSKIERGRWVGTDKVPAYLLTHPSGPERMANMDILIRENRPAEQPPEAARLAGEYRFFRASVMAYTMDSTEALRMFRAELKKTPGSSTGYFGLGLVMKQRGDLEAASDYLKKAMTSAPDSPIVFRAIAETHLLAGRSGEALSLLEKILQKERDDKAALYLLGLCHQERGEHEKAVSAFERLVAFPPVRDDVFYKLGISYGKLDRLVLAHYNFGLYFKRRGEFDTAKFHLEKAREMAVGDGSLSERIKREIEGIVRPKKSELK
jgi:predicted Zn-dependent protease